MSGFTTPDTSFRNPATAHTSKERQAQLLGEVTALTQKLQKLWLLLPQDMRADDPLLYQLHECHGDVEKLVQLKLSEYKVQLGSDNQEWGIYQVAKDLQAWIEYITYRIKENKSEESFSLESVKRPYDLADVERFQEELRKFDAYRKAEGRKYLPSGSSFYEYVVTGSLSGLANTEQLKPEEFAVNPKDYAQLMIGFYTTWRTKIIQNEALVRKNLPLMSEALGDFLLLPQPRTLEEFRNMFRTHRTLNTDASIYYQSGVGEVGQSITPFVHFLGNRYSGYEYGRSQTELRVYLNPPRAAVPQLASEFISRASAQNVPFQFKLLDFSMRMNQENFTRMDRVLFFTNKENISKIMKILLEIRHEHPEWFQDRPLPVMAAVVSDGIGFAEEPNQYQHDTFSGFDKKTSFSDVRAQFLREVWIATTEAVITRNLDLKLLGKTLREIFNDSIDEDDRERVSNFWDKKLDRTDFLVRIPLDSALANCMLEILPYIKPSLLLQFISEQIKEKAPKYQINPDNIALNLE